MGELIDARQQLTRADAALVRLDDGHVLRVLCGPVPEIGKGHWLCCGRRPSRRAAFSLRISGWTSSRKPAFAKSDNQRSVVNIGWSLPNRTLFLIRVFEYWTSWGGKYLGD